MTTGHGDPSAVGGPARHIPVLLAEVLEALSPKPGEIVVDGTFGAGGYTRAILEAGASVVAIDRDPDAIAAGREMERQYEGRLRLVEAPFSTLDRHVEAADGVVLDIGVSSMQLDEALRGFSFRADGPLDMRMAKAGMSAADVVNGFKPGDLARIFGFLGEERHAGRIARMIEARRKTRPFERTLDLADAIETHIGRKPGDKIHPATRVFQALRIEVNGELAVLERAIPAALDLLQVGGRIVVMSYQSLEDRLVKRELAARSRSTAPPGLPVELPEHRPDLGLLTRGAEQAGEDERAANPRAIPVRLRAAERLREKP